MIHFLWQGALQECNGWSDGSCLQIDNPHMQNLQSYQLHSAFLQPNLFPCSSCSVLTHLPSFPVQEWLSAPSALPVATLVWLPTKRWKFQDTLFLLSLTSSVLSTLWEDWEGWHDFVYVSRNHCSRSPGWVCFMYLVQNHWGRSLNS